MSESPPFPPPKSFEQTDFPEVSAKVVDKSIVGNTKGNKVVFILTTIGYVMLLLIILLMCTAVGLGRNTYIIGKDVRDKTDAVKSQINGSASEKSVGEEVAEKVTEGFKAVLRRFI